MPKDLLKKLISAAEDAGAHSLRVVHGGKHPKLCGAVAGRSFKFPFPKTPSDWRSEKNCVSSLKRHLAQHHLMAGA